MTESLTIGGASTDELLEWAAMVEQAGFDFYARLTSRTSDQRTRNELRFLRDEKGLHKGWFLGQLRARGGRPRGALPASLGEELEREFLAPAEQALARDPSSMGEALRGGVALERNAIRLIGSLRAALPAECQQGLERILAEEELHLRRLEGIAAP
jgi:rubrerythrin